MPTIGCHKRIAESKKREISYVYLTYYAKWQVCREHRLVQGACQVPCTMPEQWVLRRDLKLL
jgi:hypothetical protein